MEEKKPLFSVLIANYNNGRYLQEAIDSVLAQTYTHWEIVLVDDGSTDNSRQVYDRYQYDSRFHIYYNDGNKGCGYTKRRCAELASGEVCGFLDADDVLLPDAIEVHIKAQEDEAVAIAYSRCLHCDTRGKVVSEGPLLILQPGETYFDKRLFGAVNLVSYKKAFYDQTEGISARLKAGVDQDLYFKVEEKGNIAIIDKFTYKYLKRNPDAVTFNIAKLGYYNMEVYRAACERRGLDVDKQMLAMLDMIIEDSGREAAHRRELQLRQTFSYRIGRAVVQVANAPQKAVRVVCNYAKMLIINIVRGGGYINLFAMRTIVCQMLVPCRNSPYFQS